MLIIIVIVLGIDLLAFKAWYHLYEERDRPTRWVLSIFYWMIPVGLFLSVIILRSAGTESIQAQYRLYLLHSPRRLTIAAYDWVGGTTDKGGRRARCRLGCEPVPGL